MFNKKLNCQQKEGIFTMFIQARLCKIQGLFKDFFTVYKDHKIMKNIEDLNELGKRDKMRGLPSILSLFRNEFNKFNNTRAQMLDSIYHMTLSLTSGIKRHNFVIMNATLLWTS